MSNQMKNLLFRTAVRTFEDLGFFLPDEEVSEEQASAELSASACLKFTGPFSGTMLIRFYGDLLPEMSANMLGEDQPPSKQQQLDAFCELVNVTCGNVLPAIAGYEEIFDLPDLNSCWGEMDSPVDEGEEPRAMVQIGLDVGRAEIELFVLGEVPV